MTSFQSRIVKIQHLRASAVLVVLFYHLKLGFPRGYLGVDVFFVVSGFVITRSILIKNSDVICKGQACAISTNGEELFNYGNHLSVFGNQLLIKPITNLLKEFGRT